MINNKSIIIGCMRWGKWGSNFSTTQYQTLIEQCIDKGISTFDHADIYGDYTTEQEFGNALKNQTSLRNKIKIITKCCIQLVCENRPEHSIKSYNTTKEHIIKSVENSLQNFSTDCIDILLIHRPNPLLNPVEVAEAISSLKAQGKVLEFGVSNFLPHQVDMLKAFVDISYNQVEASIFNTQVFENGVLDNCLQHKIQPMAWSSLGGGNFDEIKNYQAINKVANTLSLKYNCTTNQILIAFLLLHPSNILPVIGSTKIERLIEANEAYKIKLEQQDWFVLFQASRNKEVD